MKFHNKSKKDLCLALFLLFSTCMSAQGQLQDYLQRAAENSPGLQAELSAYEAALEKLPQVSALPDPKAKAGYFILPVETRLGARVFNFSVSQSFPWFGTLSAREDEASQWAAVRYREYLVKKNALFYEVKRIYYEIWYLNESLKYYREYIEILDLQESSALTNVESARGNLVDVLRIQMERKEAFARLESLKDERENLYAVMNTFLNRSAEMPIDVPSTLPPVELNSADVVLLDSILARNPSIQTLKAKQEAYGLEKNVVEKEGLPSFELGLSYGLINQREDMNLPKNGRDIIMPQASVSIPLYRKKYKAMAREVEHKSRGIAYDIEERKNKLSRDLVIARNRYEDAGRNLNLYAELMKKAEETLDLLRSAYAVGREDYEEILRVQKQLLQYQLEAEKAKVQKNTAVAFLKKLLAKGLE